MVWAISSLTHCHVLLNTQGQHSPLETELKPVCNCECPQYHVFKKAEIGKVNFRNLV